MSITNLLTSFGWSHYPSRWNKKKNQICHGNVPINCKINGSSGGFWWSISEAWNIRTNTPTSKRALQKVRDDEEEEGKKKKKRRQGDEIVLFTARLRAPFSPHERRDSDEVLIACGHKWYLQTLQKWPILWLDSSAIKANGAQALCRAMQLWDRPRGESLH